MKCLELSRQLPVRYSALYALDSMFAIHANHVRARSSSSRAHEQVFIFFYYFSSPPEWGDDMKDAFLLITTL
jgi:hypothetical protein